jgi:hypothetical protein
VSRGYGTGDFGAENYNYHGRRDFNGPRGVFFPPNRTQPPTVFTGLFILFFFFSLFCFASVFTHYEFACARSEHVHGCNAVVQNRTGLITFCPIRIYTYIHKRVSLWLAYENNAKRLFIIVWSSFAGVSVVSLIFRKKRECTHTHTLVHTHVYSIRKTRLIIFGP